jgi:hypothetical protein
MQESASNEKGSIENAYVKPPRELVCQWRLLFFQGFFKQILNSMKGGFSHENKFGLRAS